MKRNKKLKSKFLQGLICVLITGFSAFAQPELGECDQEVDEVVSAQLPRAQSAWRQKNYREVERYLEKAIRLNNEYAHALYLLAELSVRKNEFLKAEALFAKLIEVCPNYKAEVYYFLGVLYQEGGKTEKAIALYEQFLNNPERDFGYDREVKEALSAAKLQNELMGNPVAFEPKPLQRISTTEDEYLAAISPDQTMMFFTRRTKKVNRKDGPAAKIRMVEEFSIAKVQQSGNFEIGAPMPSPFNTSFNEGGPSITADNTELYFTVCEDLNGYKNCDVYYSEKDEFGYWITPRSVGDHINNRDTWESQPSVSANGDALYFTSNRKGGIGGLDIYKCLRLEDGKWSAPILLDESINTKKDEKSPFIHSDSRTLYFTSKGHAGLGGYDIFYAKADNDSTWNKPQNIGYPINTEKDDLGLFVSLDGRTAYFASNDLRTGYGWDIYYFDLPNKARPEEVALISGILDFEDSEDLKGATVEIKNLNTKEVTNIRVDEQTGSFARVVTNYKQEDLIVKVKKRGLAFSSSYIKASDLKNGGVAKTSLQAAKLETGKEYKLNDIKFPSNSYVLDEVAKNVIAEFVEYLKENPSLKADIQGHTDDVGNDQSNLKLSENRARTVYNYVLNKGIAASRLTHHGYGETKPIADNSTEIGKAKNRRTVFVITAK